MGLSMTLSMALRLDHARSERLPMAAFALAERLTGVRITPGLLQATTFSCGSTEMG
ncbi:MULTISPECIES: DUF6461 domain-containing protein [unclassified Streptomyces]|uniref:DUF6461 domain-containing protein n=2 Tax=Streptomyces TaxID=1883 RepID=UPI0036862C27